MTKGIVIPMLLLCIYASGQSNIKRYAGDMNTPQDILGKFIHNVSQGKTVYTYYELADGQRIKNGEFEFTYYYNDKYSVKGQYKDGKKEGTWFLIAYGKDNTERDKFTVTYKDDLLNGPYSGVLYGISKPVLVCNGFFKDGHYIGDVKIENPNNLWKMNGSFNESGWAHGKWFIERKGGIPLKQEREYYEGILLKVIENDLSTGEKTVLFESKENTINDIKSTLNVNDSTLMISGQHYKRILDNRSYDDIDSRLFPNSPKSVSEIFSEVYDPTMSEFIPLVNGFARFEKDYEWNAAKEREEQRIAEAKKLEKIHLEEAKQNEERRKAYAKIQEERRLAEEKQKEMGYLYQTAKDNHASIAQLYSRKKPNIYNAYLQVFIKMERYNFDNIKNVVEVQEIVTQLINKKTKSVEKAVENMRSVDEISLFFKNEALQLCK